MKKPKAINYVFGLGGRELTLDHVRKVFKEVGEICVNELAERLEIPKANTSQHLAVLRQAGVVNTRKDGINVHYSLRSKKITEACNLTRDILIDRLQDQMNLSDLITKGNG